MKNIDIILNAELCYVEGNMAYFTTQGVNKQWGDDWDDAPYEFNAGPPYGPREGIDDHYWQIIKIGWEGPFMTPEDRCLNSEYSVLDINSGKVPWLSEPYIHNEEIWAGEPLGEFCRKIIQNGGKIYVEPHVAKILAGDKFYGGLIEYDGIQQKP